ncbi:MAG: hypothetical protein US68_C0005G0012 [Candidatus Shapirobacteria bacterium GW2011_GWE1_38_10]|uniref:Uncharacterized protein n=1 Tax=Candidatus Shapirobacteria bacterium GW2011_GWE1_38_10 TaxID=1618488 RepID=A0A0G0IHF6_9BACT|nr:MAG: hypothetical protein US46_C0001G0005 [Candidatus Shapirobacteria bacterium GW2011_GWF2_37_20]KKQ50445.1 MAG: hypothetical protein US68_C0005G0012 [Candidatus Shapirobacteria bacterium GW2011_GWE1_38_10]KKQ65101.1 MAG: hypothetical protein US85_C0001G0028 [Candidatus Shapirobacteria bacterium GW2011_GWF1_38_23]HBP50858.1 hypothetical protein [Candidatus Shapirobacteria bacterium]
MADNNIPVKILNAIQEAGTEMAEQGIKTTEQAISTVITGQELVGDTKEMSEGEMAKAKMEDERKKQEELAKIQNIPGRNVESEIKEVIQEKESEEDKEQKEFLEKIRLQREAEERERNEMVEEPENAKREAAKTQFAPGKRKKQQPDATQMSQTSEFKGGKID